MVIEEVRLDFLPVGDEVSRELCGTDEEAFGAAAGACCKGSARNREMTLRGSKVVWLFCVCSGIGWGAEIADGYQESEVGLHAGG